MVIVQQLEKKNIMNDSDFNLPFSSRALRSGWGPPRSKAPILTREYHIPLNLNAGT